MRNGGGKQKGASFERDICKQLSLWVSGGKQEDVFWRSAMSGGRSTVAFGRGKRLAAQAGDISCIHPVGEVFASRFFVECKNYADLNYSGLLSGKGNLATFWNIAKEEAQKYGKLPILIAKQNRQPTTVCLDIMGVVILECHEGNALLTCPGLSLYCYHIDWFFNNVLPPNR